MATLEAGVTIDISAGTAFQYRSLGEEDLVFICITMPRWPGPSEAVDLSEGHWKTNPPD